MAVFVPELSVVLLACVKQSDKRVFAASLVKPNSRKSPLPAKFCGEHAARR